MLLAIIIVYFVAKVLIKFLFYALAINLCNNEYIMKNGLPPACNIHTWTINCESNFPGLMKNRFLIKKVERITIKTRQSVKHQWMIRSTIVT